MSSVLCKIESLPFLNTTPDLHSMCLIHGLFNTVVRSSDYLIQFNALFMAVLT
jgi:hypothetical protein